VNESGQPKAQKRQPREIAPGTGRSTGTSQEGSLSGKRRKMCCGSQSGKEIKNRGRAKKATEGTHHRKKGGLGLTSSARPQRGETEWGRLMPPKGGGIKHKAVYEHRWGQKKACIKVIVQGAIFALAGGNLAPEERSRRSTTKTSRRDIKRTIKGSYTKGVPRK